MTENININVSQIDKIKDNPTLEEYESSRGPKD